MVKVSYIRRRNQVGDVLRWVPNARGLDISLEPPVTSWEQRSLNFALLDDYAHLDVRRLDIGATEFLRFAICQQIPLLTVQLLLPRCLDLQQLLPPAPALYLCIRTEIRQSVPGSHSTLSGVITICTPERDVVRHVYGISPLYMKTPDVLGTVVAADKLVLLVIELSAGFVQLCKARYRMPRLETLCLIITMLPTEIIRWDIVTWTAWSSQEPQ
ncbi:hypothetical protein AURDEDRAFT_178754 [Auricularia subglabra TFB-10046 SS5]|uniref:Uncharacterized protein n=1 Tax=Auricularia subglabra (strain TFB-10046 / SS5) TaxID=717982 RepID=J0D0X4_AURST|nr:hypothetical protein AURDEDRAFT_178754 [Auricularia subglabra TFB-10046 SS5]